MRKDGPYIWPLSEILAYLDRYGATVIYSEGAPSVKWPDQTPQSVQQAVLPHLKASRSDVLAHFYPESRQTAYVAPQGTETATPTETPSCTRKRLISEAIARSEATGKMVLLLKRNGRPVTRKAPAEKRYWSKTRKINGKWVKRLRIEIEQEATHVCVMGDDSWIPLPKVTTADEDYELAPKVKKKSRGA